jgi:hypothetical protein
MRLGRCQFARHSLHLDILNSLSTVFAFQKAQISLLCLAWLLSLPRFLLPVWLTWCLLLPRLLLVTMLAVWIGALASLAHIQFVRSWHCYYWFNESKTAIGYICDFMKILALFELNALVWAQRGTDGQTLPFITGIWSLIRLLYVKIIYLVDRTDLLKISNLF